MNPDQNNNRIPEKTEGDNGTPPNKIRVSKSAMYIIAFIILVVIIFSGTIGLTRYMEHRESKNELTLEQKFQEIEAGNEITGAMLYNSFPFVFHDGLWYTRFLYNSNLIVLSLHYNPEEVKEIPTSGQISEEFFRTNEIYITFNPDGQDMGYTALSAAELSLSIVKSFNGKPIAACTEKTPGICSERPTVTCDDDDKSVVFIDNSGGEMGVEFEGRCMRVTGSGEGLLKAAENLIYDWYGFI
ncbi:hypothetical protein JW968_02845 [Candidatus Woesearchaeota archaeon]|nr:hypothetical protein [Candidatus Woesearchaeota archaeon]